MGTQLQLILAAYIVNFGLTFGLPPNQMTDQAVTRQVIKESEFRENFQNLFNSITKNNEKKSEIYHDILKQQVVKEQQAFGAMKEELQIAQNRNAYKKRNFYVNSNNGGYVVAAKRETKNAHNSHSGTSLVKETDSIESSEMVLEHLHDIEIVNTSRPLNLTEERIKATPEYKYRMVIILALQLYWSQGDHTSIIKRNHMRLFMDKGQEIPHLNSLLNETHSLVTEKAKPLQEIYVELYDEDTIRWTAKKTIIPISQEDINELVLRWRRIEEIFEQHIVEHEKPKDLVDHDIYTMRHELEIAREELLSQYRRIERKMKKVKKLIEEQNIKILPELVTEDEYHTMQKEAMGPQKYSFEDDTAELERFAKNEIEKIKT